MLENHYKYVLVGGGLASGTAAEAIRRLDSFGSILLVGQEVNRPYHRPRLNTQYLRREQGRREITAQPADWFAQRKIELATGRRAAHLDTNRRTVTLNSGEEIAFDSLLIATGSSPRQLAIPGADLPNVFSLRTLDDADRLHNAIEKAKVEGLKHHDSTSRGVVAIIGGGLLGIELSTLLSKLGLAVELIVGSTHPWRKFAGETTGKVIVHQLEKHGVRVHLGHRPQSLEGDGRVQRVMLPDGKTIPCDFAITAIGVRPNTDLLRDTPITAEKAILVDQRCETNITGIFAAGDCAAVFDSLFGKHRLIDHWANAQVTGAIAGENMAGGETCYQAVNCFHTDVFDLHATCWGEARLVDRRHIRGSINVDSPDFLEIGVGSDGRLVQIISIGHVGEDETLEALVKQRVMIDGIEEAIKDPARPLAEFLQQA